MNNNLSAPLWRSPSNSFWAFCYSFQVSMGAVGIQERIHRNMVDGVDPGVGEAPAPPLRVPIRPPRPHYQPGQLRLGLFQSLTWTSVVLSCGASTTLLRLHCHFPSLLQQMLSCTQHHYLHCSHCRTGPMLTSCPQKLAITLNIGWLRLPSGSVQLFLRLSAVFL